MYYARDTVGAVSLPKPGYVTQMGFDERVVLVIGGDTNKADWASMEQTASFAYQTFISRRIGTTNIYVLSPNMDWDGDEDAIPDVNSTLTLESFRNAVTNWAGSADELTVYMLGNQYGYIYRLNETELLTTNDVHDVIYTWQNADTSKMAKVIMDFTSAGSYLESLAVDDDSERVVVAGTMEYSPALFKSDGLISFSSFFLSHLMQGRSIKEAYDQARMGMFVASGRNFQNALLDDNGNGIPCEKYLDGAVAENAYIGMAFLTGDDFPTIGAVMSETSIVDTNEVVVWVSDVFDSGGISNVWCEITPPLYRNRELMNRIDLEWNEESLRYEALLEPLERIGGYGLTFFAENDNGIVSHPVHSRLFDSDKYECDNTGEAAFPYLPGEYHCHNFHESNDVDWIKFHAVSGCVYAIQFLQLGTNVDVKLEIFDETLTNSICGELDWMGKGMGYGEFFTLDIVSSNGFQEGVYYMKISSGDLMGTAWGIGSDYVLRMYVPVGGDEYHIVVYDFVTYEGVDGAEVLMNDGQMTHTIVSETNNFRINEDTIELYKVEVRAPAGYVEREDPNTAGQVQNPDSQHYGNPRNITTDLQSYFAFIPIIQADGRVRDAWTGIGLDGAKVSFEAQTGLNSWEIFKVCDGYPGYASHRDRWYSDETGHFPTNVIMPQVDWTMVITCEGYEPLVVTDAIVGASRGDHILLGDVYMTPVDTNSNHVADEWEEACFFDGASIDPDVDSDGDGMCNYLEYLAGTDPDDASKYLGWTQSPQPVVEGVTLRWSVEPGRVYGIRASDSLLSGGWSELIGPWTAGVYQTEMEWTCPTAAECGSRMYRIELIVP